MHCKKLRKVFNFIRNMVLLKSFFSLIKQLFYFQNIKNPKNKHIKETNTVTSVDDFDRYYTEYSSLDISNNNFTDYDFDTENSFLENEGIWF